MPTGLEVFDANGNLIVSLSSRLTKVLGSFNTGMGNGSFVIPSIDSLIPWFFCYGDSNNAYVTCPKVTLTGNTITWTHNFAIPSSLRTGATVFYGVR